MFQSYADGALAFAVPEYHVPTPLLKLVPITLEEFH